MSSSPETTLRSARKTPTGEADLDTLRDVLRRARAAGADGADAVLRRRQGLSLARRLGRTETLERTEECELGLRVFVGQRQALVATADLAPAALIATVERAMAMARVVPEDPYCGLAGRELLATAFPDLDICDDERPSEAELERRAAEAEDAALAVAGVTNSEGAEASSGEDRIAFATSEGFAQTRRRSSHALSVSVLAGDGTAMQRDYEYATATHRDDLPSAAELGRSAAERAVRRLDPRKAETAQVPVIYDERVARSLLSHFAAAITGNSVARRTTFLQGKLGEAVFAPGIHIIDDPLRARGHRSRAFDGEGVATMRRALVEDGVLRTWLLDLHSARQLGLTTTGHAVRGIASPPSPSASNLYLVAGESTPEALYADVRSGLFVTELIGFGVNGVTGDYSRGASGFWIENGSLTHPVSEVTISGNLLEMFRNLTPANDLVFRYGTDAPTVRVDGLTVAGR